MKRVMIVGQPAAGKSTLARQIDDRTGLPIVHVDRIHTLMGRGERPKEVTAFLSDLDAGRVSGHVARHGNLPD